MENNIQFTFIGIDSSYFREIEELRYEILFKPYNMPKEKLSNDEHIDSKSVHLAAFLNNEIIGYCRLTIDDLIGQISRVIVRNEYCKLGVGSGLIVNMLEKSKSMKVKEVYLNSRIDAVNFYKKLGFNQVGDTFISEQSGLELIKMTKLP